MKYFNYMIFQQKEFFVCIGISTYVKLIVYHLQTKPTLLAKRRSTTENLVWCSVVKLYTIIIGHHYYLVLHHKIPNHLVGNISERKFNPVFLMEAETNITVQ